jgi:Zn-dependent M32 family carboxypeptidase
VTLGSPRAFAMMTMEDSLTAGPLEELREQTRGLADLQAACALLHWDQETMMPPEGAGARADQLATLERLHHERLTLRCSCPSCASSSR